MVRTKILPSAAWQASLCSLILVALAFWVFLRGTLAAGEDRELPPPPAQAEPPAVNVALLSPMLGGKGRSPEVLWSSQGGDDQPIAPPTKNVPPSTVPSSPVPANPAQGGHQDAGNVNEVLNAVRQEAPRVSKLENQLFEQLRAVMPQGSEGYIFEKVALPDTTSLPATGWDARFEFRLPTSGLGQAPFTATVNGADGKLIRRFSGSISIDREAEGLQVTRVVHRGESLGQGDVKAMGTRLSQLPRGSFDSMRMVEGTVARQELRPGQWLTEQIVQVPDLLKRGEAVTIHLTRGPIRITAPGITHQDGTLGEVIRVENIQSQREIYARVISRDEVQVIY